MMHVRVERLWTRSANRPLYQLERVMFWLKPDACKTDAAAGGHIFIILVAQRCSMEEELR